MIESKELKKIKKKYGESFMRLCRELFPTILEQEGKLEEILLLTFANNSRTLGEDIKQNYLEDDFRDFIYSKLRARNLENEFYIQKNPYDIFTDIGYDLVECLTEEDIQKFRKYYEPNETLCTFNGGRLNRCIVFFAVKKNVDEIKREDFKTPRREDEYGTSVMSIQFNRFGMCTVSIKNRYNHTVNNPDATYGNDLNRIAPGLKESFVKLLQEKYNLILNNTNIEELHIPNYVVADDGRYYKYNVEMNGTYFCPGNIIIQNGEPKKLENPENQMLIDYFILDLKNKTIKMYENEPEDSFIDAFHDLSDTNIKVENEKEKGIRVITISSNSTIPVVIKINRDNQIIEYENQNLKQVGDYFLYYVQACKSLKLPNLEQAGNLFLGANDCIKELILPKLKKVGTFFLYSNQGINNLEMPMLEQCGESFLRYNVFLTKLELPNLKYAGDYFLAQNGGIKDIQLPNLLEAGQDFLFNNEVLDNLELPNLLSVGDNFLYVNTMLSKLKLYNLRRAGDNFLYNNHGLTKLELHSLENVGDCLFFYNDSLKKASLPNLKRIGDFGFFYNTCLRDIDIQNLEQVGNNFFYNNCELRCIQLPKLKKIGEKYFVNNKYIKEYIDKLKMRHEFREINSCDIATLDKLNSLTVTDMNDVNNVEKIFSNTKEKQ